MIVLRPASHNLVGSPDAKRRRLRRRRYRAVVAVFDGLRDECDLEMVFTDNHSTDATWARIAAIAAADPRVRGYRFSRNFGYQRSILTGYLQASGNVCIQLDCDLEDPPALIPEFLRLWREGNHVVYGVRRNRHEPALLSALRRAFYWLLDKISEDHLPRDAGDFRLVDRRLIEELRRVRDPHLYIRGRIAAMGFRQIGVPYDRDRRVAGQSKFNVARLMGLALDATLSHSVVPLRLATYTGLALCVAAGLLVVGYVIARFVAGSAWPPGFATTVVLLLLAMGLQGLFLGIIGEYLARIYQHLKQSPETIVQEWTPAATTPAAATDPVGTGVAAASLGLDRPPASARPPDARAPSARG